MVHQAGLALELVKTRTSREARVMDNEQVTAPVEHAYP